MPKMDENTKCHFFDIDCYYPISEDELKLLLEELEEGEVLATVPSIESALCTNCLLSQLLRQFIEE